MDLLDELNAENGSFLLELRTELNWNTQSFDNLLSKLKLECKKTNTDKKLQREYASGIWYISKFVNDIIKNESINKALLTEQNLNSIEKLNNLTYEYFMGYSIMEN